MKLTPSQRCNRKLFLSGIALQLLLVIVVLAAGVLKLTDFKTIETDIFRGTQAQQNALREFEIFIKDWCRVRQARTDVESVLGPCHDQLNWTFTRNGTQTNGSKSFISHWDLKPAGQFSRFYIQAVASNGVRKTTGGDWWRVFIRSPVASLKPAVFDLGNGTHEIVFLIVEPGIYHVEITLDYTLCDGFRDPPDNWFIVGNFQGKMQPKGWLRGRAKADYLLQPLQGGKKITMNIIEPLKRGYFPFNTSTVLLQLMKKYDLSSGMKCRLVWDGYGRWEGYQWKPYLKAKQVNRMNKTRVSTYNTLMIYGDSQANHMFNNIKNMSLCQTIFKRCEARYNWVYRVNRAQDNGSSNQDFNQGKVLGELKQVLELPHMSENSVLVLNLGLHYLQTISFSKYIRLLQKVVEMLKSPRSDGTKKCENDMENDNVDVERNEWDSLSYLE